MLEGIREPDTETEYVVAANDFIAASDWRISAEDRVACDARCTFDKMIEVEGRLIARGVVGQVKRLASHRCIRTECTQRIVASRSGQDSLQFVDRNVQRVVARVEGRVTVVGQYACRRI